MDRRRPIAVRTSVVFPIQGVLEKKRHGRAVCGEGERVLGLVGRDRLQREAKPTSADGETYMVAVSVGEEGKGIAKQ